MKLLDPYNHMNIIPLSDILRIDDYLIIKDNN